MKKRMKDRPGLLDDAQRLADAGRKGDKLVAHITPEEAALLKARGGSGTVNPRTGLLEFFSESDPMGSGSDYGYSDGRTDADRAASENATNDMVGNMNADVAGYGRDEGARGRAAGRAGGIGGFNDTRTGWDRVSDWFSQQAANVGIAARTAMNNPARTAMNAAIGFMPVVGPLNTAIGLLAGQDKTLGHAMRDGIQSFIGYDDSGKPMATALGEPDGPPSDPNPGESNFGRPSDAPATPQQVASQTTPTQVAQDALRRAFMVNPALLNQWQGNQFMPGGTAGRPNAYNQWQGNQLYRPPVFPGLIG